MTIENVMKVIELATILLMGIGALIPAAVRFVQVVQNAVVTRNWTKIISIVTALMAEAEERMEDGATRKEWVMGMTKAAIEQAGYNMTEKDWEDVGTMIDSFCEMSKVVNAA